MEVPSCMESLLTYTDMSSQLRGVTLQLGIITLESESSPLYQSCFHLCSQLHAIKSHLRTEPVTLRMPENTLLK